MGGGLPVDGLATNPQPAHVINLSLSAGSPLRSAYQATIDEARRNGAIIVASAGNLAIDFKNRRPANCKGVI